MNTVLIIEDEHDLLQGLRENLELAGYRVLGAATGEQGLALADRHRPDLVLLDVMLPQMDGLEVFRCLRATGHDCPVIFLSAKSDEMDRVEGLELGADDYVTKPFSLRELLARIRARLRESEGRRGDAPLRLTLGAVEVDFSRLIATRGEARVPLTAREFEILRLLAANRGRIVPRTQILQEILGYSDSATTRTVDTHILNIRQKIEDDPAAPRHIQTVYGEGYRLVE